MKRLLRGCGSTLLVMVPIVWGTVWLTATIVNPRTPSNTDIASSALLADPPPPLAEPVTLTMVTFNIQSLWVVGWNRPARMRALGQLMQEFQPDIVGWQEAFIDSDRELLIHSLEGSGLVYHEYYPSATMGSGLMISSRYPIREALFHRFEASNPWHRVWEGDWWAGKGVALARIEGKGFVDIFNTHAQAGYGRPSYIEVRKDQMRETAAFMAAASLPTAPVFYMGDINARDGRNAGYELIVDLANLERLLAVPSAIDHIFGVVDRGYAFEVEESWEFVSHNGVRLSDHNGYASRIRITPVPTPAE
jgi:endonuclease/exonuclease/phosphatase family metal-dependent hydrolase